MTVYKLDLRETDAYAQVNTTRERLVAALETNDAATMAATLRAVADRLDPPQRVTFRRDAEPLVPLRDANGPHYAHDADCNTIHEAGPEPCPPPRIATPAGAPMRWRTRITSDGCGLEHTFTGSCALAGTPLPVVGGPTGGKAPSGPSTPS